MKDIQSAKNALKPELKLIEKLIQINIEKLTCAAIMGSALLISIGWYFLKGPGVPAVAPLTPAESTTNGV